MWYFAENGDRKGPITPEEVKTFIESGKIGPATLVWQQGLEDWVPITETELRDLIPDDLPPPTPGSLSAPPSTPRPTAKITSSTEDIEATVKQLDLWFMIHLIALAAGMVLSLTGLIPIIGILTSLIGAIGFITSFVFVLLMCHQFWKIVQDGNARTTPEKAVGFMCIPFFNLYWYFVAVLGLAKDMNEYMEERQVSGPRANENLALVHCIIHCFWLFGLVPYLGHLLSVAIAIISVLNYKAIKEAAIAILRSRVAA